MAEKFERHRQPWTSDEIQKLHRLAGKGMSLKGISKAMTRSVDVVNGECDARNTLALRIEDRSHAIGAFSLGDRCHQFKRRIGKREDRGGDAVLLRTPRRSATEQRLIPGDARLDIANENDRMIES